MTVEMSFFILNLCKQYEFQTNTFYTFKGEFFVPFADFFLGDSIPLVTMSLLSL